MRRFIMIGMGMLCSSLLWGQSANERKGYTIEGQLSGEYTGKVYLVREEGIHGEQVLVDSCVVVDGRYRFQGPEVKQVMMYFIKSSDGQMTPLFLENGTIRIKGKADNFLWAEVGGTLNNDIRHYYSFLERYVQDSVKLSTLIDWTRFGRTDREVESRLFRERSDLTNARKLQIQRYLAKRFNDQPFAPFIIMFEMTADASVAELKALRAQLDTCLNNHPYVKQLEEYINTQEFGVGSMAYDFVLPDLNGREIELKSYRGKYVLLDFWASWCGPCRREMPNVVELYKSYKGKRFEVIGISLDKEETLWKKAVKEMKMTWPQGCDLKAWSGETVRKYNVQAVPRTFLLDPQGRVVAIDLRGDALKEKLKEIIKK